MAKVTVKIYDNQGNVVDELPYGSNGITGTNGSGKRQQVYMKTDENGNRSFFAPGLSVSSDPFEKAGLDIDEYTEIQAPQVTINDGQVVLNAPQEILDSPLADQIRNELQSLKGADLNSQETRDAINTLNEEIKKTVHNWTLQGTLGWTEKEFADYQRLLQAVRQPNPMSSNEYFNAKRPGADFYYADEDGRELMSKTPQEWIDYWKETFDADTRTELYKKSLESTDPYERVMGLIMSAGGEPNDSGYAPAVYGYNTGEYINKFWETAKDNALLFPKGIARMAGTSNDVKRVEDLSNKKGLNVTDIMKSAESMSWNADDGLILAPWTKDEESFEKMKNDIKGKTWRELSDAQKLFVIELGVSEEAESIGATERQLFSRGNPTAQDLDNLDAENDYLSRTAINNAIIDSNYDRVKTMNSDLWKWLAWDEENVNKLEEKHADDSLWAAGNVAAGNIAGTIGRFLWENAVGKALTGHSMNKISDSVGNKIVDGLAKIGISPVSKVGQNSIRFAANLIGTIPEDIVQTSVDNIVTYNADENKNLFNLEQMSENFKNNLILMAGFNIVMAGFSSVRKAQILKQLAKQSDLDTKINAEGVLSDGYEAARIIRNGGSIEFEGNKVYGVDADGKRIELNNVTVEQAIMLNKIINDGLVDTSKAPETPRLDATEFRKTVDNTGGVVDDAAKAADNGETSTVKIETDSPNGKITSETPEVNIRSWDDIDGPTVKVDATPAGVLRWHSRALNWIMSKLRTNLQEFHNRFGDVRASDFDWIWYNSKVNRLSPDRIIGTTDPITGRVVTQNMIDAAKWWGEQDFTKRLRMGSLKAMGNNADYNVLGYLPHTSYDPSTQTLEEAISGMLWKKATGKSVMKDGEYVGYGGTLAGRYRTFASNMLWDMRSKEVAAAKLIDEAMMEGKTLAPEEAMKMVEGGRKIVKDVNSTSSYKGYEKAMLKNGSDGADDFKKAMEDTKSDAKKMGLGRSINKNYAEMYFGAGQSNVTSQPEKFGSIALNVQGDIMRKIKIGNGMDMYSWGGADLVYASQNAIEFVNRVMRDGLDWREALIEFVEKHSHRSKQYAEAVADRMIERLANDSMGELTKGVAIKSLSKSFKSEAWSRLRKWLVSANYDQFNKGTQNFIDEFLFRHMQLDSLTNNQKIITKITDGLTGLRYRSLFYGNFKNALLQVSELSRLFTVFNFKDVAGMLKRLATDADFRTKVDMYVEAVAPETTYLNAEVYGKYANVADTTKIEEDGVKFGKLKDAKKTIDDIALAPIQAAEALKNRTMIAALVQEADRLEAAGKITGANEKLMRIRQRFERVALAQNEMGRIGLSTNPIAKPMLFLQNFQMRELGMHYYNLKNPDDLLTGTRLANGSWKNSAKYLTKVFGAKMATTLILARFGYTAAQTLGFDPFGIADGYNRLDEEEMNDLDKQISNGFLTPLVAGGITSLFSDMYFMAREAYEDAHRETVSDEAEESLKEGDFWNDLRFWEQMDVPEGMKNGSYWGELVSDFMPGNTAINRFNQMNEMLSKGWATSTTGNKMYTAPNDLLNILKGYLFGRSATDNALQYQQNYGKDLGQTLSRTLGKTLANMFGGGYNEFDPIDTKNYTDWFDGSDNDAQQFQKGKRYFQSERDRILDAYEEAIRKGYDQDEIAEAKAEMNKKLDELFEKVGRFVNAYEKQHGTITGKMVKELVNLLNIERRSITTTSDEDNTNGLNEYDKALERYTQLGLPNVGTYTGPSKYNPKQEVKYQGSPQWRVKSGSKYDLRTEAVAVLSAGDAMLKNLRKNYKDEINSAYDRKDYNEVKRIQKEYLKAFDNVVGPILATYGSGILSNGEVVEKLREMLSADSGKNSDFVPRDDWSKGTNNRYISSKKNPIAGVNLKKWLQQRYSSDVFKTPTIRSSSTTQDDLDAIKRLVNNGQTGMARARALTLKVRIDNQRRSINNSDYQWLLDFLNNGGNK